MINMASFEWDESKNQENIKKHGVDFHEAQQVFSDPHRYIFEDTSHSTKKEMRWYCLGKINNKVCTIRFTHRNNKIRIFGAGYWRKERKTYERQVKNR